MYKRKRSLPIIISALGVVYGDIGTSPLYALKSCFRISNLPLNEINIIGIISLFTWSLILIVSIKYINFVLKFDHQGEGGIFALSTLIETSNKYKSLAISLGIIGASLFFGDSIITTAISVLSAVEGIAIVSKGMQNYIIPITLVILTWLFFIQKYGSSKIGKFFGPIMLIWFLAIFLSGLYNIFYYPQILYALNPYNSFKLIANNYWLGISIMGGIIIVVTGAEALYADLGHFGRKPISKSWNYIVFPSLITNYLGQGAKLIIDPNSIINPFYYMLPDWAIYPMLIISTFATIIASQAVLSGLFSVTYHAILLNYLPSFNFKHTSEEQKGQVYTPIVNWCVYIFTVIAILHFKSAENLAALYGLCVSLIMLITTSLLYVAVLEKLQWSKLKTITLFAPFVFLELFFILGNLMKLQKGAWYVLLFSSMIYTIIFTWRKGTNIYKTRVIDKKLPIRELIEYNLQTCQIRIPSTALFLSKASFKTPNSLLVHLKHNKYLHERVILLSFKNLNLPFYDKEKPYEIHDLKNNSLQIISYHGFMQKPNVKRLLEVLRQQGIIKDDISIFLTTQIPIIEKIGNIFQLWKLAYYYLTKLRQNYIDFYDIPITNSVETIVRYKI